MDKRIGITTTIPAEVVFAAGCVPVDLNNAFITGLSPNSDIAAAEASGFPRTYCAWIKGIYGAAKRLGITRIIGVVEGDCCETSAMLDVMASEGVEVIPFAYPREHTPCAVSAAIASLCHDLGCSYAAAEEWKRILDPIRAEALAIDRLAHEQGVVPGRDLFYWLVNTSDFLGNPEKFAADCKKTREAFQAKVAPATSGKKRLRLGLLGVPPIITDLVEVLEAKGGIVVFHEVPRQFALPFGEIPLAEAYCRYSYPYAVKFRLEDCVEQARLRRLDGVVHYVQSFCHRQLHDRLLREGLPLPVLTIEGDRPGPVDGRTLTRLEAFLESLPQGN